MSCPLSLVRTRGVGRRIGGGFEPEPLQSVFVLRVVGVGQDVHQVRVAPDASAVIRWGGAPPARAARIARCPVPVEHLFYQDVLLPVVAEVVGVTDLTPHAWGD